MYMRSSFTLLLGVAMLLPACSDDDRPAPPVDTILVADGGTDVQPVADADVDVRPVSDSAAADTSADGGACAAKVTELTALFDYPNDLNCSAVVRLDHNTKALKGYQVICGGNVSVDEATARATAESDTGYGQGGQMLNAASPEDVYVFYESPGDFGGAAAVSARSGLTLFGGSIIWLGTGDITYPTSWRPAADLISCGAGPSSSSVSGYDLVGGTAMQTSEAEAIFAEVKGSALVAAMLHGGYLFDVVVLRYPRAVGAFDPSSAEYIVLINGGWLE